MASAFSQEGVMNRIWSALLIMGCLACGGGNGWTPEEYAIFKAGALALDDVEVRVAEERPEIFVGGVVGPEFDATPRLYIKGPTDEFVVALVAAAPVEIVVFDEQPFAADEINARQIEICEVLIELGFWEFSVNADIEREALMEVLIEPAPRAPKTPDAVLAALPPELRVNIEITFEH
jgi:hypothetical protein